MHRTIAAGAGEVAFAPLDVALRDGRAVTVRGPVPEDVERRLASLDRVRHGSAGVNRVQGP